LARAERWLAEGPVAPVTWIGLVVELAAAALSTEETPTTMSAAATATATLAPWHARHRSPAPREPHIAALPLVEPTPNAIA
jgi:hypothetical protein